MDIKAVKRELTFFIHDNMPLVALNGDYHFVIRKCKLTLLKSNELTVGDIRMLQVPAKDLIKGLSDLQWSTLLQKYITLKSTIELAITQERLNIAIHGLKDGS